MARLTDRLDGLIGAKAAALIDAELQLRTAGDLLRHYPLRYITKGKALADLAPVEGEHITVVGTVVKADVVRMKSRRGSLFKVAVDAGSSKPIGATFFSEKPAYLLKIGVRAMISGNVKYFRSDWELSHPGYLILPDDDDDEIATVRGGGALRGIAEIAKTDGHVDMSIFGRDFLPIYPATAKLQTWDIAACIRQVLDVLDPIDEPLSAQVRESEGLVGLDAALRTIHFPDDSRQVNTAKARVRFDEALAIGLLMAQRRSAMSNLGAPPLPAVEGGLGAAFAARLPFELTEGQSAALAEISADLCQPHPMSRLLQGEVGSGKTVVALAAMLQAVDNGYQCALLAPTEVLAAQHYRSLQQLLGPLAMAGQLGGADNATSISLITGSMSTAAKRAALLNLVSGDVGIAIGTHALIQDNVEFFNLGLVVVDEQHRFGVEQRDALRSRARDGLTPHMLVMTATPIPRTIAMTVLGDLDTTTLRELPRGRQPIKSTVVSATEHPTWVDRGWQRIREEVADGRQAYVVCSRIGDGDDDAAPATTSVLQQYERLTRGFFHDLRVGLLHGRLDSDEKDRVMRAFSAGQIDVLVCTTVIEVGVDVPNATVMVIVDADRFGVSQLHQLRGRIGRGGHPGLCLLVTKARPGSPTGKRLETVAGTTDGFALAEFDLENRQEGDVLGASQSGATKTLRLLSLLEHGDIIERAHTLAADIIASDPGLTDHPGLAALVSEAIRAERAEYLTKS